MFAGDWADAGQGLGGTHPAAEIYSLMLATFLGTMGLPHVLVRFYTNIDGGSARATTVRVIALLGVFYLFPTIAGVLIHQLLPPPLPGQADSLLLRAAGGHGRRRCWATCSARWSRPARSPRSWPPRRGWWWPPRACCPPMCCAGRVRDFRVAAVVAGLVPLAMALPTTSLDISRVVGMAFAVAASTFCPLLVLGIWWRGLTTAGAIAGLIVGGGLSLGALTFSVAFPGCAARRRWIRCSASPRSGRCRRPS